MPNGANYSEVGVGLIPSRDDSVYHMGHMWLRWKSPFSGDMHHRGYWPILDDLPANLSDEETRTYLCNNKVRGLYKVDTAGRDTELSGTKHRAHAWNFAEREFYRLTMGRCSLPDGYSYRIFGHYSCNEALQDTDNCSSWAIASLRHAKEDHTFIACQRTKRLSHVEIAIWGNNADSGGA